MLSRLIQCSAEKQDELDSGNQRDAVMIAKKQTKWGGGDKIYIV